jgi:AcrR family transcriptional regulator
MAKPKSPDKRNKLLEAATRVIVLHGLGASTALIAKEAGVSSGSLFTYFETKADLFNELYLEIKSEMASIALQGVPANAKTEDEFYHLWVSMTRWAVSNPEKRRVLAQLAVCEEITQATRDTGHKFMANVAQIIDRSRANGPLCDAPMAFAMAIINSVADTTMDFMVQEPQNADRHCELGFRALWRMLN